MNYIVFDSYPGEVDFVNAAEVKAIERRPVFPRGGPQYCITPSAVCQEEN